jgi:hypothetical protein
MNLTKLLNLKIEDVKVILVGTPEETNILDSNDQPYLVAKLKNPVVVRCSVDVNILPQEVTEVYFRKSALDIDGWVAVDEAKPEDGFYLPKWVVDFSVGQQIPIYQETSIKAWTKTTRGNQRNEKTLRINQSILDKIKGKDS